MPGFLIRYFAGLRQVLAGCLLAVTLAGMLAMTLAAHAQAQTTSAQAQTALAPVVVDGRASINLWPAVTLLIDPGHTLTLQQVLAQPQGFLPHAGTPSNLGHQPGTVWLRVPLHVAGQQAKSRVLEIDYPALNHIDAYLLQAGQPALHHRLGNALPLSARPMPSRSHAVTYSLPPGDSVLMLRVQTTSSMVLPLTLRTPEDFTAHESRIHLLQGLMAGLAACMLIYSLAHWVSLRDSTFVDYALVLGGNLVFTLTQFGIGGQYLWPEWPLLSMELSPRAVLVAVIGGVRFMRSVMGVREISRVLDGMLRGAGLVAGVGLALSLTGLLSYGVLQSLTNVVAVLTLLAVVPAVWVKLCRGHFGTRYMLAGRAVYVCGALATTGLLRGLLEPTFWTQYLYPLATLAEMSAWMMVLSLRVQSIHRNADRARIESDALRALAHSDPLTGLINRRGLQDQLAQALQTANPQRPVAVYLIDLDGFKSVNDRHGHDVGDALLIAAARRLQRQLRHSDAVARLGGDEFVVLALGLDGDDAARAMGEKLVAAFRAPLDALGHRCTVGLTVGYALAPQDGSRAESLIKRADEAMYAGKQAGRGCVTRAGARGGVAATA
jgi:diguanylate cyclase (GGDEF)-like protein